MIAKFKPGDIVCHKATFLRSICWFTDVPINGRVESICDPYVKVQWCDRGEAILINPANIILYSERHLEPC